jgi:heptosyltransferase-2
MAENLGAAILPQNKPQLFLSQAEVDFAEEKWRTGHEQQRQRLLLAPGAGLPQKRWAPAQWEEIVRQLAEDQSRQLVLIGSAEDAVLAQRLERFAPGMINLAGCLTLRQTLAMVSRADAVVCHSSMILHAAAAWEIPTLVLLGPMFSSAEQHAQQWGYPHCAMLAEASPEKAVRVLTELCYPTDPTDRSDVLTALS